MSLPRRVYARKGGPEKRFWAMVCKGCEKPGHDHSKGCWIWLGSTDKIGSDGYGRFRATTGRNSKLVRPARFAYFLQYGVEIQDHALHKCDIRACVRVAPDHIYDGSLSDNTRDFWRHKC